MDMCKFEILNNTYKKYCEIAGIKYKKCTDAYWIERALQKEIYSLEISIENLLTEEKEVNQG